MTVYEGSERVSSIYGMRTLNGVKKMHNGIDLVGVSTKYARATIPGYVEYASTGYNYGRGQCILIRQDTKKGTVRVRHQHASALLVAKGQQVTASTYVIKEGVSGDVTGSHDHYEVVIGGTLRADGEIVGGKIVDPATWLGHANAVGTYPQNDNIYDYATGSYNQPDKTEVNDAMKRLKVFQAQNVVPSSALINEGWIMDGAHRMYNPKGDAVWVREFESNISPTFEEGVSQLSDGYIMMVVDD